MTSMIELVAKAICRTRCKGEFHPCDSDDGLTCKPSACGYWRTYEDGARTAIEAMREPTEAMIEDGYCRPYREDGDRDGLADDNTLLTWQAMIDAALKEQP